MITHILALLLTYHTIQVAWQPAQQAPGFTTKGYYIYQSVNGSSYNRQASTSQLSWNQNKAIAGKTYCYKVTTFGYETISGQKQSKTLESVPTTPSCVTVQ